MAEKPRHLFTSESVTEGHPDKIADQISDAVLDAVLEQDPYGRVACEVLVTTGICVVAGEITTTCYVDVPKIARETIQESATRTRPSDSIAKTCGVLNTIQGQSPDIAMGVDPGRRGRPGPDVRLRLQRDGRTDAAADPAGARAYRSACPKCARPGCSISCGPTASRRSAWNMWTASPSASTPSSSPPSTATMSPPKQLRAEVRKHVIDAVIPENMVDAEHQVPHQPHGPLRRRRTRTATPA